MNKAKVNSNDRQSIPVQKIVLLISYTIASNQIQFYSVNSIEFIEIQCKKSFPLWGPNVFGICDRRFLCFVTDKAIAKLMFIYVDIICIRSLFKLAREIDPKKIATIDAEQFNCCLLH